MAAANALAAAGYDGDGCRHLMSPDLRRRGRGGNDFAHRGDVANAALPPACAMTVDAVHGLPSFSETLPYP
jgi:hypothetical protein